MKRSYDSPQMNWMPIRSNRAVADVCWAFAKNVKPFYYNTYGTGYAELYAMGGECTPDLTFEIKFIPENMSEADKNAAKLEMAQVEVDVRKAMAGLNKVTNFKGSPFSETVDPSWS